MRMITTRFSGLLGLLSVMLLVAGNELSQVGGGSPPLHAPANVYEESVASSGLALLGTYIVVLAWLAFAGFFAVLAQRLAIICPNRRGPALITASAAVAAAVAITGAPPLLAAMVLAQDGDLTPPIAKALLLLNAVVFVLSWALAAVPIALCSLLIVRQDAIGRWVGWSGLPLSALLTIGSVLVWHFEPAFLIWLLTLLWVAATSVALAVLGGPGPGGSGIAPTTDPVPANLASVRPGARRTGRRATHTERASGHDRRD